MKNKKLNYKHALIVIGILLILVTAGLTFKGLMAVNDWYENHTLEFQRVVTVIFKRPIVVKEREIPQAEIIRVVESIPEPEDLETDIEKKIYEVFGIEHYRVAIAVAKAESGLNCNAVGVNTNGTADLSVFQVNTLWLKHYTLAEITNCERNVEIAHDIWDRGDGEVGNGKGNFNAWVAFKNGNFIAKLEE